MDAERIGPFLGDYDKGWQLALEDGRLWFCNTDWNLELLPTGYRTGTGGDLLGLSVRLLGGASWTLSERGAEER